MDLRLRLNKKRCVSKWNLQEKNQFRDTEKLFLQKFSLILHLLLDSTFPDTSEVIAKFFYQFLVFIVKKN